MADLTSPRVGFGGQTKCEVPRIDPHALRVFSNSPNSSDCCHPAAPVFVSPSNKECFDRDVLLIKHIYMPFCEIKALEKCN